MLVANRCVLVTINLDSQCARSFVASAEHGEQLPLQLRRNGELGTPPRPFEHVGVPLRGDNHIGDQDGALADYAVALEIEPDHVGVYDNRGWLYRERGAAALAILDYTRAIEIDPRYANGYNNRGLVHLDRGAYAEAVADFDKAIELGLDGPRAAWPHNNRGFALARQGADDPAVGGEAPADEVAPPNPAF
jgi:tetratricopeptide (TPR) repeat protein